MWAIRVVVGPWFDNLPHAGGYGQAATESAADALLLVALWRRLPSPWVALAAAIVIVTSAFDLALSAIDWTPPIASALGKAAVALILLDWHRTSVLRAGAIAALAWCALQVYTGAVFVTAGVVVALALQIPYVAHRLTAQASGPAMGAVTGSVGRILSGDAAPEVAKSLAGYRGAFNYIHVEPWRSPLPLLALAACTGVVVVRYRRDPVIVALVVVPQVLAIAGYALFLGTLDHYYYIPLMPVTVLAIAFAVVLPLSTRAARVTGPLLFAASLAIVPGRLALAATLHRLPEYRLLTEASRAIANRHEPVRSIRTEFVLPPSTDPEFVYRVLGGRLDATAPRSAIIRADGTVQYVESGL